MNDRLPLQYLNAKSPTFLTDADERFTESELETMRREFALRLKSLFPGLTDADIARRLKIAQSTVKNYFDGERLPNPDVLIQIERVTGVNLHWLLTGKGSRRVEKGDLFSEEEETAVNLLAKKSGRSFDEQVKWLVMGAVEFLTRD